jgi:hypothetical protein
VFGALLPGALLRSSDQLSWIANTTTTFNKYNNAESQCRNRDEKLLEGELLEGVAHTVCNPLQELAGPIPRIMLEPGVLTLQKVAAVDQQHRKTPAPALSLANDTRRVTRRWRTTRDA